MKPQILTVVVFTVFATMTAARADMTISKQATQRVECANGVCSPHGKHAVLNVNDLAGMLAGGDVTIESGAQNVDFKAALNWTSSHRLTLSMQSAQLLTFYRPVVVAGPGALTITTSGSGDFRFIDKGHLQFWSDDNSLIINGKTYVLVQRMRDLLNDIKRHHGSLFAIRKDFSGGTYSQTPISDFDGTIEGLGNTISNLTVNGATDPETGLVGWLRFSGTIRDLTLVDVNISTTTAGQYVGALIGANEGSVISCHVSGQVSASGTGSSAGGLSGTNGGSLIDSSANVAVSSTDGAIGGLIGWNVSDNGGDSGVIDRSFATGMVIGGDDAMAGGLVGQNAGSTISNSYSTGAVTGGNNAFVGGLVGVASTNASFFPVLQSSYSTGTVSGGSGATVGGLIGEDLVQTGTTNSYWDMDTSGISDPAHGAGNVQNDPGITGLTDTQLTSGLPSGFSPSVWKEKITINSGYPYLIDNPLQ